MFSRNIEEVDNYAFVISKTICCVLLLTLTYCDHVRHVGGDWLYLTHELITVTCVVVVHVVSHVTCVMK